MNEQASPDHIGDSLRAGVQGSALSKDTYLDPCLRTRLCCLDVGELGFAAVLALGADCARTDGR